jgi:exonuclease-1
MGIQGLLPKLKSVTERIHVSQLKGKTVAIDAYCLLHKGAYTCSRELVEGIETDKCVNYCLRRIDVLIQEGVQPYVVFDGGPLPNKKEEEMARAVGRKEHREKARSLWGQGSRVASMEFYQRAVDITPDIANGLVQELHKRDIPCVVAPYEADAQCAYLAHQGIVDVVLTEDSDLLAYGCPRVVFKFDGVEADQIQFGDLAYCRELSFVGWDLSMFQQMCVMAGCDFVKALPGIGIKKAHAHMRRTRSIQKALRGLKFDGVTVTQEYEKKVQRALWTFKYQRVYCPKRKRVVHLHDIPEDGLESDGFVMGAANLDDGEEDFLGKDIPASTAQGIAEGRLNPFTWLPFTAEKENTECNEGVSRSSVSLGLSFNRQRSLRGTLSMDSRKRSRDGDDDISVSIQNDGSAKSSGFLVRKPNGQLMAPLSSLKSTLQKALCYKPSTNNTVQESPESVKEYESWNHHVADEERKGKDTCSPPLFTPMWKPKRVESVDASIDDQTIKTGDMPLSPSNFNCNAIMQAPERQKMTTPLTPGFYLPETNDSPENNNVFEQFSRAKETIRIFESDDYFASNAREAANAIEAVEKQSVVTGLRVLARPFKVPRKASSSNRDDEPQSNPFSAFASRTLK